MTNCFNSSDAMEPSIRMLFRDVFLVFIGIGLFGIGLYYAVKFEDAIKVLGIFATIGGAVIFLVAFGSLVSLLWRTGCLGMT